MVYLVWWEKPRNVASPVRISTSQNFQRVPYKVMSQHSYSYILWSYFFGTQDDFFSLSNVKQVPIFWSGEPMSTDCISLVNIGAILVGGICGAIHCIAWSFEKATFTELVLWRFCSLAIFGIVLPIFAVFVSWYIDDTVHQEQVVVFVRSVTRWLVFASGIVYVMARVTILLLALIDLRNFSSADPEGAAWVNFIPHVWWP
jgi:hypothetical protein